MTVETKVAKLLHIKIFPHNTVNKVWQKKPLSYGIKSKYYRLRKIYDCVKQETSNKIL